MPTARSNLHSLGQRLLLQEMEILTTTYVRLSDLTEALCPATPKAARRCVQAVFPEGALIPLAEVHNACARAGFDIDTDAIDATFVEIDEPEAG